MNYDEFEARLTRLVSFSSEAARFRFAHDTIRLLHRSAWGDDFLDEFLTEESKSLLAHILVNIDVHSTFELKEKMKRLKNSVGIEADDFIPDVTDLLSAMDNWLEYRATRDPRFIIGIALDMVNMLDYYIGGDCGEYSTDNMLGAPEMLEEFHRQEHFLTGH